MNSSLGLWMLPCVALLCITGVASWVALIIVSLLFAVIALASGATFMSYGVLPMRIVGLLEHDLLQALPLYVLMGCVWYRMPLAQQVVQGIAALARRMRAGASAQALAMLCTALLFAPINGSAGASVTMLGKLFSKRTQPNDRAMMAAFGTLGVVVPPSLVLMLLGDAMMRAHTEALNVTQQHTQIINTQMLLQAALWPAALLVLGYAVCVLLTKRQHDEPHQDALALNSTQALSALLAVLFIVLLLVGVTRGVLLPVEAAATACLATLIYALLTRALSAQAWRDTLDEALALSGALFALLLAATTFSLVFRSWGTDVWLTAHITQSTLSPTVLVLCVMAFVALCALALDAFEIVFVVVPIVMPPLLQVAPNATWIAVLTLLVLQLSYLMPPLGIAQLLARGLMQGQQQAPMSLRAWLRKLAPYLIVQLLVITLVCLFPELIQPASGDEKESLPKAMSEEEVMKAMQSQSGRDR
jgi:tripartite ATP-independent transporter DctM subunit